MSESPERLSAADWLLVGLFGVILAIILLAVFFRYVVNESLFWSDEVVRYLFVWFTLLGSALVLRDRRHIRVEYFVDLLPNRVRRGIEAAGLLLVLGFNVFLVSAGFVWAYETRGAYTPALGLPLALVFQAALPTTAALGCYFAIARFKAGHYSELDVGEEPEVTE